MTARIFQPTKSAMQSGLGKSKNWLLEFEAAESRQLDPLMGWTGSADTQKQVRLQFDSKEEAIAYAKKHGLPYKVHLPKKRKRIIKAYADNFKYGRKTSWTH